MIPAEQPSVAQFSTLGLDAHYRTGERDPVGGFYQPCLSAAIRYSRAVGYFRSSIFSIVGRPFLEFARRGGTARLVCSPSITEDDAQAIASGYLSRDDAIAQALDRDLQELLSEPALESRTKLLATLIECGSLDIRLAVRSNGTGIYHEKIGIFTDGVGERVSFIGSSNETWSAWHTQGNHESIEVFREWVSSAESERVQTHAAHFERLWDGLVIGVDTVAFPEAQRKKLLTTATNSLDDVDVDFPDEPIAPASRRRSPMEHQLAAIAAWEAAGRHGVFEHATGSGKTFTAITAIKKHLASDQPAIVLVPSQLLLEQWRREIEEEIPDSTILMCGGGHTKWKTNGKLRAHTSPDLGMNRIVLSTMQTAATDTFINGVYGGDHLLIVADEIHQIGSPFNARAMAIQTGAALGLSATPIRYGDPEGTANIFKRFGPVLPPPITLQNAIDSGRLVNYEYHPHPVHLSEDEAERWKKLTKQISFELAKSKKAVNGNGGLTDKAKMLLIQRSRIAKKAQVKPGLAAGIICKEYEPGQRWLVYCEDSDQLSETMGLLTDGGLHPIEYHSGMEGDRPAALEWFTRFGGVLVSINCLDEGIDIPAVSHAFILASSQNPRQFIQRRGRVLRKSGQKLLAVIHDAIVVPVDAENEPEQIALLKAEMIRALQFADAALNKGAGSRLRSLALSMGITIDEAPNAGIEDEGDEKE
ncbi:DEAD/DEAH box helicase family protein [Rhodoferax sp. OV413]|uniref:DEAD/DEAH box helicase family protein n=1 Tax=Rhodoferax sp. OV413 TaxID=1855285 RepID=UPI0025EF4BB0|nr:DEAD/DEAH box helicase family protein [Rhodoferax sp. OV413]